MSKMLLSDVELPMGTIYSAVEIGGDAVDDEERIVEVIVRSVQDALDAPSDFPVDVNVWDGWAIAFALLGART